MKRKSNVMHMPAMKKTKVSILQAAKLMGLTRMDINLNARHFGITPTEVLNRIQSNYLNPGMFYKDGYIYHLASLRIIND